MSRINASVLWDYFKKISGTKKSICTLCGEEYSFATTTGNLKAHLKKKHKAAFTAVSEAQEQARNNDRGKQSVIYEYVVVPSPTSSVNEATTTECITKDTLQSRESLSEKRSKLSQEGKDTSKENRLIKQLTEEKIRIANLQKELIEKEMEEKNLKITLLQDEMKHKKILYECEKYEIEHRKQEMKHKNQMNDLAKQEMLLKIEVLNATLNVSKEKKLGQLLKVEKSHIVNLKKELDAEELNERKLQLELIKEEMEHKRELNKLLQQVSSLKIKEKFL